MGNAEKILVLLNQALRLEYSLIIHYPLINRSIHDNGLKNIFQIQLAKEKLALQLHSESSKLIPDMALKTQFEALAVQEEEHIKIVESILSWLNHNKE